VKSMRNWEKAAVALASGVALAAAGCSNPSQDVAGGSNGSTDGVPSSITLKVPYSAGGGTDTWARFVAPYLQESLPGNPRVTVENVEGGESVTGSNEYFRTAPDDGSQVLVTSGTTYLQALLEEPGVEFDFAQMTPLMLNGTGAVAYVSSSTGIEDAEEKVGGEGERGTEDARDSADEYHEGRRFLQRPLDLEVQVETSRREEDSPYHCDRASQGALQVELGGRNFLHRRNYTDRADRACEIALRNIDLGPSKMVAERYRRRCSSST
jgi:hypothetical protein